MALEEKRRQVGDAAACCMLCVTMTIVYCRFNSKIRSSMCAVEAGSKRRGRLVHEQHFGSVARARAIHSRCCVAAGEVEGGTVEAVLHFVPQGRLAQAAFADFGQHGRLRTPATRGPKDDVLEDRLGERVRLLEDHADAAAQVGEVDARR